MAAGLASVPNATFAAEGGNLPRNLGIVRVGLTTQINAQWSWFIDTSH